MNRTERPAISAFVITRNEAKNIGECLASLGWVDEIVVVDDFSSDETRAICSNYNVRFFQHSFTGFINQKRYAMSLTTNDWVLEIDADERVSEQMRKSILSLDKIDFDRFGSFNFRRLTRFWGKWIRHASLYPDYKARLYNKHKGAWSEANIHERFITTGATRKLEADILHEQDLDIKTYLQRTARYSHLSAEDMFNRGKRALWHHVTIRPFYTFFYRYIIRLGFAEGLRGFVISFMGAVGTFLKYSKLYELQKNMNKRPSPLRTL
jgi:glycosyltransferase involved in cell wall biosynthesis